MAAVSFDSKHVRPLRGAVIRRYKAANAHVEIGSVVYVDPANGMIDLADATDTQEKALAKGVVVAIGTAGALKANAGDMCDVVVIGPVETGTTGNTPGAFAYVSTTAGDVDETAPASTGNYPYIIGWFESDTVFFVQPQMVNPTAV